MSLKITDLQNRINPLNLQYDAIAGDQTAGGTGTPLYQSLWGVEIEMDNATALQLSYTSTGTLYAGLYRYVKFISPAANTIVRGQPTFWVTTQTSANLFASDQSQYTVSIDPSASIGDGLFAGVAILVGAAATGTVATSTQWGWIQSVGIAYVKYRSSVSDTTIGDLVIIVTNTVTFDSIADATSNGTATLIKNIVGVSVEAAANSGVKRVSLWPKNWIF